MHFLIVEDDTTSRISLQGLLSAYGDCDCAADGKKGLEAFEKALKSGRPYNVICLDIIMPDMNGYEVLAAIRTAEYRSGISGLDGVKVIVITTLDDEESIMGAFRAGCESYIQKPVVKEKLITELRKLGFNV